MKLLFRGKPILWSRGRGKGSKAAHAYLAGWRAAYCGEPISLLLPRPGSPMCERCIKALRHWEKDIEPEERTRPRPGAYIEEGGPWPRRGTRRGTNRGTR